MPKLTKAEREYVTTLAYRFGGELTEYMSRHFEADKKSFKKNADDAAFRLVMQTARQFNITEGTEINNLQWYAKNGLGIG